MDPKAKEVDELWVGADDQQRWQWRLTVALVRGYECGLAADEEVTGGME